MPPQTASEDQQYKVKVRHYQRSIGFVHHINDVRTTCDHVQYVDDWTTWESRSPSGVDSSLQTAADEEVQWINAKKMALNYDKTKETRICFKKKRHTSRR